jgi:hypothetical protein
MKLPDGYRTATPDGLTMTVYGPDGEVVATVKGEGLELEEKAAAVAQKHAEKAAAPAKGKKSKGDAE